MRQTKKLISLLLALAMVFAFATPAWAAPLEDENTGLWSPDTTGKIVVTNPKNGVTYTAYQIFKLNYGAKDESSTLTTDYDPNKLVYTITKGDHWFNVIATEGTTGVTSNVTGLNLSRINNTDTFAVTVDDSFSVSNFAAFLHNNVGEIAGKPLFPVKDGDDKGMQAAEELTLGYYLVLGNGEALCNLTTVNKETRITDKNDIPFDKVDDAISAEIGQEVHYTITGKVPNTSGYTEYVYKVTDTMSEGLTFDWDSVKVKVDTREIDEDNITLKPTKNGEVQPTADNETNGFELTINVIALNQEGLKGKDILITYTATVNEKALGEIQHNDAALEYTNNPSGGTSKLTDRETVYTLSIVIDKYDDTNKETKLSGARFVLYKYDDTDPNKKLYYYYYPDGQNPSSNQDGNVKWKEVTLQEGETLEDKENEITIVETNNNGFAKFPGLKEGTYYLEETKAPDHYNLLQEPVKIELKGPTDSESQMLVGSGVATDLNTKLTLKQEIANHFGSSLPSTGGIGTTLFYIVGGILMVGAAVLLITKRRMDNED